MPRIMIRSASAPRRNRWQRFFRMRVAVPRFSVAFPERCPHCLGPTTKSVAVWTRRVTGGNEETHLRFEVPTCAKVREPVWARLALLVLIPLLVIFSFAAFFEASVPAGVLSALLAYATWRTWRSVRWVRLVWYDEDHYVFAARRADWLAAFAEVNRGAQREITL